MWKKKDSVVGVSLKPNLVWQHLVSTGQWKKVVVDVKVTSTEDMGKAFKEKDEKSSEWVTRKLERGRW